MAWNEIIENHKKIIELFKNKEFYDTILDWADVIYEAFKKGNKLLICGNGGSAADAQHIAAELVGRFERDRIALPAIALTVDTSILTAVANDYSYETIFAKQIEALGNPGDVLLAITTSGNSKNVVEAIKVAKKKKLKILALLGKNGGVIHKERLADSEIIAPLNKTRYIQEAHIIIYHEICELIEKKILGK